MMKNQKEKTTVDNDNSLARSEIQEYLDIRQQRRWIFPRAALVGACAGIVALLFRAGLTGADVLRNKILFHGSDSALSQ